MKYLTFAFLLTVLCSCSSVRVVRDYEPGYSFSALETFAWKHAEQPDTGNPRLDNDLYDQRIRDAVDAELQAKGFSKTARGEADFLVAYFVDYKQRIGGGSFSFGLGTGGYGRYGGVGYNTGISDYEEAHLTIDFIDPTSDDTFWRATGRRTTYEGTNPEKTTKIVRDAVSRILGRFPPKP